MNQKIKYITEIVLSALVICALTIPAFALTESDVQSQVSASGKEGVAGNLFVWFLCAVAFLKISQKIDSFMQGLGINVGHTGGSMLAEAMLAARSIAAARGVAGRGRGGNAAAAEAQVAAAVTAIPSCKAVWPVSLTAASITAHTRVPPAQEAAALAAWRSAPL